MMYLMFIYMLIKIPSPISVPRRRFVGHPPLVPEYPVPDVYPLNPSEGITFLDTSPFYIPFYLYKYKHKYK